MEQAQALNGDAEILGAVERIAERSHGETRDAVGALLGGFAMDVANAVEARLQNASSGLLDARYLVEVGVAREDVAEADAAIRRGDFEACVRVRATLGRLDDLLRRLEGAMVRSAASSAF